MEEILSELVLNWDHTRVHYVPTSNWTMERMGSKRIEVVGLDDKRQITLVFGASMSGDFLPPQVKYSGKTTRCLPPVKFPDDWNITYTENHWANENTTEVHIKKILISYIESSERSCISLPVMQLLLYLTGSQANALSILCPYLKAITSDLLLYHLTVLIACSHWMLASIKPPKIAFERISRSGTLMKFANILTVKEEQLKWLI